jgi:intron-binding protein aquarius
VDKFQGQQNDYILLSLCRTRAVGHIRDVRRLVVATSRSRLGLYVFGRRQLFENCYELAPTFKQLLARPDKLAIVPTESHPCSRGVHDKVTPYLVEGLPTMNVVVNQLVAKWQASQSQALRAELPGAEQEQQGEDEGVMETEEANAEEVMEEEVVEPQEGEASPKTGGKNKSGRKAAAEPEPEPEAMETDAAEAQVEETPKTGGKGKKGGRGRGKK